MGDFTGPPLNLGFPGDRETGYAQQFQQDMETINAAHQGLIDGSTRINPRPPLVFTGTGLGQVLDLSASDTWEIAPAALLVINGLAAEPPGSCKYLRFTTAFQTRVQHNIGVPGFEEIFIRTAKDMVTIAAGEWLILIYIAGLGWVQKGGSIGMGLWTPVIPNVVIPGWPVPAIGAPIVPISVVPFVPRTATGVHLAVFNICGGPGPLHNSHTLVRKLGPFPGVLTALDTSDTLSGAQSFHMVSVDSNGDFEIQHVTTSATSVSSGTIVGYLS